MPWWGSQCMMTLLKYSILSHQHSYMHKLIYCVIKRNTDLFCQLFWTMKGSRKREASQMAYTTVRFRAPFGYLGRWSLGESWEIVNKWFGKYGLLYQPHFLRKMFPKLLESTYRLQYQTHILRKMFPIVLESFWFYIRPNFWEKFSQKCCKTYACLSAPIFENSVPKSVCESISFYLPW